MSWNPIATAPRDGTRILVSDGRQVALVYWSDAVNSGRNEWREISGWVHFEAEDGWYNSVSDPADFTHWMPLPEPPSRA